jgi:N-acyl-D-aspartate/D-glutamate deacylase
LSSHCIWFTVAVGLGFGLYAAVPPTRAGAAAQTTVYELVVANGRVLDPDSGLDAVRHVGIRDGSIAALSESPLQGRTVIEARGLAVSPGFIDLHEHAQNDEAYAFQAADGVTTSLELELGTADIAGWYRTRAGRTLINHGASIGHIPVRMAVMGDSGVFLPVGPAADKKATDDQIAEMRRQIETGLRLGAPAVGFGVAYTHGASRFEILEMMKAAAAAGASAHIHLRGTVESAVEGLEEAIASAAVTGASVHVVHVQSTGARLTPQFLEMIAGSRARGLDVTTECYPYTAGMTRIESAILDDGWQERLGISYADLQWPATGERLTAETFAKYRKSGGMVAIHSMTEETIRTAVASPLTMIASDGILEKGQGHPRAAGTYARVLGRYVREQRVLTLMEALRKMTLMPARRLERRVPAMTKKGRLSVGADADIVVFDPDRIADRATFERPAQSSVGIAHVLVNGVAVVRDGQLVDGVKPGRAVRAPH